MSPEMRVHLKWPIAYETVSVTDDMPKQDGPNADLVIGWLEHRLPGVYAGACLPARRSRRDRVASF